MTTIPNNTIGLIAGQGDFPISICRGAHSENIKVIVLAVRGFCNKNIEQFADVTHWIELGQTQRALDILKSHDIHHVVMAGRIPHQSIFQYRHFDALALKVLAHAVTKRADGLLGHVVNEMKKHDIEVLDSSLFVKSLMQPEGYMTTKRKLDAREEEDIRFGLPIARVVAGQDIGQTIVVKDKAVIAVEGFEGTDECIKRAGNLAGDGTVIVKVSKPQQDKRFDIPVIGKTTVKNMIKAGASVLAFSADETLVFDKDDVIKNADEAGIVIIAVKNPKMN